MVKPYFSSSSESLGQSNFSLPPLTPRHLAPGWWKITGELSRKGESIGCCSSAAFLIAFDRHVSVCTTEAGEHRIFTIDYLMRSKLLVEENRMYVSPELQQIGLSRTPVAPSQGRGSRGQERDFVLNESSLLLSSYGRPSSKSLTLHLTTHCTACPTHPRGSPRHSSSTTRTPV
eukprot:768236-Hanusia_phi.AAC.4